MVQYGDSYAAVPFLITAGEPHLSTKTSRQPPSQKQKQKQTQGQNRGQQSQQQGRTQSSQTPKAPSNPVDVQAAREARINRQAEAKAVADRRRRMKTLRRNGILAALVLGLVAVFTFLYIREANKPGQSVASMANRDHIAPGASHVAYSTNPPSSGPHVSEAPQFKVYTQPMTDELAVHGLEDWGVIINYKPDLDKASVDKLASIATSYEGLDGGRNHVLMTPHDGMTDPIVLTAWTRIDRMGAVDEARIRRFIDEYVGIDHHEGSEGVSKR